jgi:hypothetical protein
LRDVVALLSKDGLGQPDGNSTLYQGAVGQSQSSPPLTTRSGSAGTSSSSKSRDRSSGSSSRYHFCSSVCAAPIFLLKLQLPSLSPQYSGLFCCYPLRTFAPPPHKSDLHLLVSICNHLRTSVSIPHLPWQQQAVNCS